MRIAITTFPSNLARMHELYRLMSRRSSISDAISRHFSKLEYIRTQQLFKQLHFAQELPKQTSLVINFSLHFNSSVWHRENFYPPSPPDSEIRNSGPKLKQKPKDPSTIFFEPDGCNNKKKEKAARSQTVTVPPAEKS